MIPNPSGRGHVSEQLSVSPLSAGPLLIVAVDGEVDWATACQLREQLAAALAYGPQRMILDLTELRFCNLEGVRTLVEVTEAARQAGVDVALRGMSRLVSYMHCAVTATRRSGTARSAPGVLGVGIAQGHGGSRPCGDVIVGQWS